MPSFYGRRRVSLSLEYSSHPEHPNSLGESNFRSEEISPRDGVSSHLMKSFVEVTRKTFEGTEVIAVLSQIIPANERLMSFFLASLVKLPFWFLCVKKNRSPSLVFLN